MLLNNKDVVNKTITDCVGKVGFCEYVTDPKTDKLYQNTTLILEKESGLNKKLETILKKENLSEEDVTNAFNTSSSDNEIISEALKMILELLIKIDKKIQ